MVEVTVKYNEDDTRTIIGNPHYDKFWDCVIAAELVSNDFSNDDNQINHYVNELKEDLLKNWHTNSTTLTLIGLDEGKDVIIELARKYRSRGHIVGAWNWTHDYYVISKPNDQLRIPGIKTGKDGFGRFGNHVVSDF